MIILILTLNQNPNLGLEIMSYADCRGSQMYNLELSNERAKSVINYIRSKIDNKKRVFGRGFGEINLNRTKWLIKGVSKGIGDYGNAFGIPIVGGAVSYTHLPSPRDS